MFKAFFFTSGMACGVYYGIHLRDNGLSQKLTKSYYSFHDENKINSPKISSSIDHVIAQYEKGLLDKAQTDKYRKMVELKQWDRASDIIPQSADQLINQRPEFLDLRQARNALYRNN